MLFLWGSGAANKCWRPWFNKYKLIQLLPAEPHPQPPSPSPNPLSWPWDKDPGVPQVSQSSKIRASNASSYIAQPDCWSQSTRPWLRLIVPPCNRASCCQAAAVPRAIWPRLPGTAKASAGVKGPVSRGLSHVIKLFESASVEAVEGRPDCAQPTHLFPTHHFHQSTNDEVRKKGFL